MTPSQPATWYNADRVAVPGSVILSAWKAEREAARAGATPVAVRNAVTYASSSGTKGSALYEWLTGAGAISSAGPAVTERTALAVGAVYACIGLIGGAIASLPLQIYRRSKDGRERVDHDVWWLLNQQPTDSVSAAVFWEYLIWSLLLHGDALAMIQRPSPLSTRIIGFDPLHPLDVSVTKLADGRLHYTVPNGIGGQTTGLDQSDILHIPGIGFDGCRGLSPLRHAARQTIGLALAADEYSARFFSNGARPDYVITTPNKMDEEQARIFRESWMARYAGIHNAHIPAILTGGGDVKTLSLNPEDAQLIETRNFQAADIARFYGVPPHMIGLTDKATSWGSGIEQQGIGFVKYTLQRHLVKIEQEINRKVFGKSSTDFAEFNTAGLERGDYKSRNEGYRIALGRAGEPGWMAVNEVRRLENLPPKEGGDDLATAAAAPLPAQEPKAP
jgi:HK97 family phage portal protein